MGIRNIISQIKNIAGNLINPATEEKQDLILSALTNQKIVDVGNTHNTLMQADEEFIGQWIDTSEYVQGILDINTDAPSAIDGLIFEFSNDGLESIHNHKFSTYSNYPYGHHFSTTLDTKYFRVRYINGNTPTTHFHLITNLFKIAPEPGHVHPLSYVIYDSHQAEVTRSVITAKRPDGEYDNIAMSFNRGLFVHELLETFPEISTHLTRSTGNNDTLSAAAIKGEKWVQTSNVGQWSIGNKLKIIDGDDTEYDLLTIKNIIGSVLYFDRSLDANHNTGTIISPVSQNMVTDGSATNIEYKYKPRAGQNIYIRNINVVFGSSSEPSLELFGGIPSLANGLHFKIKKDIGRDSTYWIPLRSNNSFRLSGFTYQKEEKVGTIWYAHLSIDLKKECGSAIYLEDDAEFVCIVQDNLTGLSSFEIKLSIQNETNKII
jgi:hypothetical protein